MHPCLRERLRRMWARLHREHRQLRALLRRGLSREEAERRLEERRRGGRR